MAETAVGSSSYFAWVAEATWATTPPTPAMRFIPLVSESMDSNVTTLEPQTIRPDRQYGQSIQGNIAPQGDVNVEWNADALGFFMYYLLGTTPTVTGAAAPFTHVINQTKSVDLPSVTMEKGFVDIDTYLQYVGARVNRITFAVAPDAFITGALGMMAQNEVVATAPLIATPTDVPYVPFNSFDGAITEGGTVIATATKLDLTLENQLNSIKVIGSRYPRAILAQRFHATGTLEAFFVDSVLYTKFIDFTNSALIAKLQDQDGGSLELDFKAVNYTGKTPVIPGEGPIFISMPFAAHHDSVSKQQVVVTVKNSIPLLTA
jgi:hypothetical protein